MRAGFPPPARYLPTSRRPLATYSLACLLASYLLASYFSTCLLFYYGLLGPPPDHAPMQRGTVALTRASLRSRAGELRCYTCYGDAYCGYTSFGYIYYERYWRAKLLSGGALCISCIY
eukprot:scaffold66562_cov47-Phaeocystis_antarctica.AAC.4